MVLTVVLYLNSHNTELIVLINEALQPALELGLWVIAPPHSSYTIFIEQSTYIAINVHMHGQLCMKIGYI